jgi:DNA-binding PadR family transcriptional regulator
VSLKHALLGFLSVSSATGYELKGIFESTVQHFWNADLSQIYRTLDEIKADGLATVRVEPQQSKPPRHIYSLCEKGREELRRWLREPVKDRPIIRNQLLLKVFFGAFLQKAEIIAHLQSYQDGMRQRLAIYDKIGNSLPRDWKPAGIEPETLKNHLLYAHATLRLGIKIAQVTDAWCTEIIGELRAKSTPKIHKTKKKP